MVNHSHQYPTARGLLVLELSDGTRVQYKIKNVRTTVDIEVEEPDPLDFRILAPAGATRQTISLEAVVEMGQFWKVEPDQNGMSVE